MVKHVILSFAFLGLISCSSLDISNDYPNQKAENEVSGYETASGSPASYSYEDILRNSHPEDEVYDWPLKNAPDLLKNTKEGEIVEATGKDGKPVLFAVLSEYPSAGKKLCKKYFVNLELHLACYNPHWYPVRSFEE